MTCTICGRYADPDPETGYDADNVCDDCRGLPTIYDLSGLLKDKPGGVDPIESDLHDLGSVLASLADLVKNCHNPNKLWDVYVELGKLAKAMMELQDAVGRLQMKASPQDFR